MSARLTPSFRLAAALIGLLAMPVDAQVVSFGIDSFSADEGVGFVAIPLELSAPSAQEVSVILSVTGGTATRGTLTGFGMDVLFDDGPVTFAPGETQASALAEVLDDNIVEKLEWVEFSLSSPVGATVGGDGTARLYITDNDSYSRFTPPAESNALPTVRFTAQGLSVIESNVTVNLDVILTATSSATLVVMYQVEAESATAGEDFALENGSVTIPLGETRAVLPVEIKDDRLRETNETFRIVLLPPPPELATLASPSNVTFTIVDNDRVLMGFATNASSGAESESPARVDVILSNPSVEEIRVAVATAGSAGPSDYVAPPTSLTFAPGVTTQTLAIAILNDTVQETNETIVVTLSRPVGADLGSPSTWMYTILDDDWPKPRVQFVERRSFASESATNVTVALVVDPPPSQTVSVVLSTSGTATSGADYVPLASLLSFGPGSRGTNLVISLVNDNVNEADESIILTLSTNATDAMLGSNTTHTFWIRDDDAPPESIVLFEQRIQSVEPGRELIVVGPRTAAVNPRGLAVDYAGNLYITDAGVSGGAGDGSVLMKLAGQDQTLRLLRGLDHPRDIELGPGERTFVFMVGDGALRRHGFGLSVRPSNAEDTAGSAIVYVMQNGYATRQERISPDGYFHFLDLLLDSDAPATVDVMIENGGRTRTYYGVPLGQAGAFAAWGHTVTKLEFP